MPMIPADEIDVSQLHIDVMRTISDHSPKVDEVVLLCTGILAGCVAQLPSQRQSAMRVSIIRMLNELSNDDNINEMVDFAPLIKHHKEPK
jgi:hypothetical protein